MRGLSIVLLSACLIPGFLASDAAAIVIRHDRDDARYLDRGAAYPAAGTVVGIGECTLVAPRWVVTAAHVAQEAHPGKTTVRLGGIDYPIAAIVTHPSWIGEPQPTSLDIALIELGREVEGIEPAVLYSGRDEQGKEIVFVGRAMTGTGLSGPDREDGKLRVATNTVDATDHEWITFRFDAPPRGTDLEGISGPGDSGNGALFERDGRLTILGVGSGNDDGGTGGICRYGSTEYYVRISSCLEWIHGAIGAGG